MAAAVPLIGSIITSFLVSKAIQVVGEKIGLSDSLTNILAIGASIYAGGMTYKAVSASQAANASINTIPGTTVAPSAVSNIPGTPLAATPPVSNIPGTPLAPAGSPLASTPSAGFGQAAVPRPGMLSEPSAIAPNVSAPPPQTPAGVDTAGKIIEGSTGSAPLVGDKSWVDRLFSPDKTVDLIMAGMQGYGKAGVEQYKLEYPEGVAEKNAAGWADAYPGKLSLTPPQFPSQGGG